MAHQSLKPCKLCKKFLRPGDLTNGRQTKHTPCVERQRAKYRYKPDAVTARPIGYRPHYGWADFAYHGSWRD